MLWMRMMFVMHESRLYGHLSDGSGRALADTAIVRLCGLRGVAEYRRGFAELEAAGVPARSGDAAYLELVSASIADEVVDVSPLKTDEVGVIYSRRMLRDHRLRVIRRLVGEMGVKARGDLVHQTKILVDQTPHQNADTRAGAHAETDTDIDSPTTRRVNNTTGEGVQGKGATPDFALAASVAEKLGHSALREAPPDQIVVAWLGMFGAELITETLVDCEDEYRGKGWQYLKRILESRKANPSQRPGQRPRRKQIGDGNGRGYGTASRRRNAVHFAGSGEEDNQ